MSKDTYSPLPIITHHRKDWMACEGVVNGIAKEPSHQQGAEWLVDAYTHIPNQVARNVWMKQGYAWFEMQ